MHILNSLVTEFDLPAQTFVQKGIDEFCGDISEDKIYWFHCDTKNEAMMRKIQNVLKLDDEILELVDSKETMPTMMEASNSLTLRIQCLSCEHLTEKEGVCFTNLVLHIAPHYCLTLADGPIPAINTFHANFHKTLQYAKTPGFILFLLLDNIINDYSNILFEFELAYDSIDFLSHSNEVNLYAKVMSKKQELITVTRYLIGIRGIMMRISGRKISVISEPCRLSLTDLLEHVQMILSEATAIREMLNGILDQIDNSLMHNMNKTMKLLTAFSAIFLPLTLVAGIYGMNFIWIPELHWKYGYFFSLGLMLFIGIALVMIFKKQKMF